MCYGVSMSVCNLIKRRVFRLGHVSGGRVYSFPVAAAGYVAYFFGGMNEKNDFDWWHAFVR